MNEKLDCGIELLGIISIFQNNKKILHQKIKQFTAKFFFIDPLFRAYCLKK